MGWVCVFDAGGVTGVLVGSNTMVGWQRTMEACCSCDADLVAGDDLPLAHVDVGLALDLVYLLGDLDVEVPLAVEDGEIREELGQKVSGPLNVVCLGLVPVVDVG
jgi:hypothetical protein